MLINDFFSRLQELDKFCRNIGGTSEVVFNTGYAHKGPNARVFLDWKLFTNPDKIYSNISELAYILDILPETLLYRHCNTYDGGPHAVVDILIEISDDPKQPDNLVVLPVAPRKAS